MNHRPRQPFRSRFYYTRKELLGVLFLIAFAAALGAFYFFLKSTTPTTPPLTESELKALKAYIHENQPAHAPDNAAEAPHGHAAPLPPFPFDPNRSDSATLRKVGLRDWQIRNMMKYRAKGGIWRTPDDFSRLYGLSDEEFTRLRPYIRIHPDDAPRHARPDDERRQDAPSAGRGETDGRPRYPAIEKFAEGTVIDLNTADTTALKRIPGIGSYRSRQIVNYREQLGGFLHLSQLDEIEDLPPDIARWFSINPAIPVKRLNINTSTFKQLNRHPYLSYEQTCDIMNYRRKFGKINGWRDLAFFKTFTSADFERLQPYFTF